MREEIAQFGSLKVEYRRGPVAVRHPRRVWHLARLLEAAKAEGTNLSIFQNESNEHVYQQRHVFAAPDGEAMVIEPGDVLRPWREPPAPRSSEHEDRAVTL